MIKTPHKTAPGEARHFPVATFFENWRSRLTVIGLVVLFPGFSGANSYLDFLTIRYNDSFILDQEAVDSILSETGPLILPALNELDVSLYCCPCEAGDSIFYILEGLEENWNQTVHPQIRYTNLAEGFYSLKVSDISAQDTIALNFQVTANDSGHLLEKWWFQPLLTFCLLLIPFTVAYFLSLDRSRRNLRVEVIRNQIAGDLHDDVGANLSAINNLTELLKKRRSVELSDKLIKVIDKIKSYTEDTLVNLQDTVWAINPLNDSVEQLLEKMKDFAILMFQAKEVDLKMNDKFDPRFVLTLDMQQRHSMFMMFKEVVNNIVKHAQADSVAIDFHNSKNTLTIQVADDGVGFDNDQMYAGNGLKNFEARAKENFIDLDLSSEKGKGTKVQMVIYSLG